MHEGAGIATRPKRVFGMKIYCPTCLVQNPCNTRDEVVFSRTGALQQGGFKVEGGAVRHGATLAPGLDGGKPLGLSPCRWDRI